VLACCDRRLRNDVVQLQTPSPPNPPLKGRACVACEIWRRFAVFSLRAARRSTCAGRRFPVTLIGGGSSTVTLLIAESKVNAKCPDRSARLTVIDTDTLEGEFSEGNVLRSDRVAVSHSAGKDQ